MPLSIQHHRISCPPGPALAVKLGPLATGWIRRGGFRRPVHQDLAIDPLDERAFRLDVVLAVFAAKRRARRALRQRAFDDLLTVHEDYDRLFTGTGRLRTALN